MFGLDGYMGDYLFNLGKTKNQLDATHTKFIQCS
jgi:hypothetical protein